VAFTQLSSSSNDQKANTTLGFLAVLVAAVLSGFAGSVSHLFFLSLIAFLGVYFERILKNSKSSVWMRNIQMAFSSIALALGGVYFSVRHDLPFLSTRPLSYES
jgi:solute carrier family 35 (UDP-sugar transporter), member A1/2/3